MTCNRENILDSLRFAADRAYEVPSRYLGLNDTKVTLVTVENSGVDAFGENGTKTRTDVRLTVGDGYVSTLSGDGYINCNVSQVSAKDIFLSGGILTDKCFVIGPIVFPYTACNGETGGTAIAETNPSYEDSVDKSFYFFVQGPSFPDGVYMKRKWSREDSEISYFIYVENTGITELEI